MRLVKPVSLSLLVAVLAACASTPPPAAPAVAKQAAPAVVPVSKLTGDQIVALQMQGYKLVNNNGETLWCETDVKTGSHLLHDNTCLTERQVIALREETQRRLQMVSTPQPPKQGT